MSRDDAIVIVKFRGRYYVEHQSAGGENWYYAVFSRKSYATLEEAMVEAERMDSGTEYGIQSHTQVLESEVLYLLDKYLDDETPRAEIQAELETYRARRAELQAAAQQHQVVLRDDSRLQKFFLSGGLEYLETQTLGKVTTLEQLCQEAALMSFAVDKLNLFRYARHWQPLYERENKKLALLQHYRKHHPVLPEDLHPLVRAGLEALPVAE